jgi:hypothetical protein
MNESGWRVQAAALRSVAVFDAVTHARQHGGDILREQERNSANVGFRTALGKHDALEARSLGPGWFHHRLALSFGRTSASITEIL